MDKVTYLTRDGREAVVKGRKGNTIYGSINSRPVEWTLSGREVYSFLADVEDTRDIMNMKKD